jgi:hypothetical protein
MKTTLTLGTILLGCSLVAFGQSSSSSATSSDQSSGAGYSQGATGTSSSGSAQTSGSEKTGQTGSMEQGTAMSANQGQAASKTSLRGCLTQAADGNYMLAETSGNTIQLAGDTSQLKQFVGQEVRVEGSSSGQAPGAMAAPGEQQQFSVSKVHKISGTCRATSAPSGTSNPSKY